MMCVYQIRRTLPTRAPMWSESENYIRALADAEIAIKIAPRKSVSSRPSRAHTKAPCWLINNYKNILWTSVPVLAPWPRLNSWRIFPNFARRPPVLCADWSRGHARKAHALMGMESFEDCASSAQKVCASTYHCERGGGRCLPMMLIQRH